MWICVYNFTASLNLEACCNKTLLLKERKLSVHLLEDLLLGVSEGGCFSLPRLGSLVVCLQSPAIHTFFPKIILTVFLQYFF